MNGFLIQCNCQFLALPLRERCSPRAVTRKNPHDEPSLIPPGAIRSLDEARPQATPSTSRAGSQTRDRGAEERIVLSTVTWNGEGGDPLWSNMANWTGNALPGSADDVVIPDLTGDVTITADGTRTVKSVTSAEGMRITGSLTVTSGVSTVAGPFSMASGATLTVNAGGFSAELHCGQYRRN